jgi:hypothetical protein
LNRLIKEIIGPDGKYKAIIELRKDRTYEINILKFTHEIVPGYGEVCDPFWEPVSDTTKSIVDTLSNAEKIAKEKIEEISGNKLSKEIE